MTQASPIRKVTEVHYAISSVRYADGRLQKAHFRPAEDFLNDTVDRERRIGVLFSTNTVVFGRFASVEDDEDAGLILYMIPDGDTTCRPLRYDKVVAYFFDDGC